MWLPDYVKSQEEARFKGNSSNICVLVLRGVRGCSPAACGQLAGRAAGQARGYHDHRWTWPGKEDAGESQAVHAILGASHKS